MRSLALESSGEHRLSIAAFGSRREKPKMCPVVNLVLARRVISQWLCVLVCINTGRNGLTG